MLKFFGTRMSAPVVALAFLVLVGCAAPGPKADASAAPSLADFLSVADDGAITFALPAPPASPALDDATIRNFAAGGMVTATFANLEDGEVPILKIGALERSAASADLKTLLGVTAGEVYLLRPDEIAAGIHGRFSIQRDGNQVVLEQGTLHGGVQIKEGEQKLYCFLDLIPSGAERAKHLPHATGAPAEAPTTRAYKKATPPPPEGTARPEGTPPVEGTPPADGAAKPEVGAYTE